MERKVAWKEGEGNIVFTRIDNFSATAESDAVNESLDREQQVTFSIHVGDFNKSVTRTVRQEGKRERFNGSDALIRLADGGTFNVLKSKWGGGKRLFFNALNGVFVTSSGKPFTVKKNNS